MDDGMMDDGMMDDGMMDDGMMDDGMMDDGMMDDGMMDDMMDVVPEPDTLIGCCVIGQAEAPEGVIEAWKSSQEAKQGYGHQQQTEETHHGHQQ